jgi:integrase
MHQLPLVDDRSASGAGVAAVGALDPQSELLFSLYRGARLAEKAHPRSVAREVSQLRSIARDSGAPGQPIPLPALLSSVSLVACVLREPRTPVARSTSRARLVAVQRCLRILGPRLGQDVDGDLAALDALLPVSRSTHWHRVGIRVAGGGSRRRPLGPTLEASDVRHIVEAAGVPGSSMADRDRAIVALHCFSGLRAEEIVRLRWGDLATRLTPAGYYGTTASVRRNGQQVCLPLPCPAAEALQAWADACGGSLGSLTGPVFPAAAGAPNALSYRAARDVLRAACERAGLPPVGSVELRSACAHWLRTQGFSPHEVAAVLGLVRVRSVDRLLRRHTALDAQRAVKEVLAP